MKRAFKGVCHIKTPSLCVKAVCINIVGRPMMILTEFMESGSLDNFLKVAVLIKLSSPPGPKLELRPWWPCTFHGINRFLHL